VTVYPEGTAPLSTSSVALTHSVAPGAAESATVESLRMNVEPSGLQNSRSSPPPVIAKLYPACPPETHFPTSVLCAGVQLGSDTFTRMSRSPMMLLAGRSGVEA